MSEERGQVEEQRADEAELPREQEAGGEEAARLAARELERDEYLDALRRLKAEFDNYRKRVAREHAETAARAAERLVKQLLPLVDDLGRALEAFDEHGQASLGEGVRLVQRALEGILEREGVVEVPAEGRFDPHRQEALLSQPSELPEGTVLEVLQKGYMLGDHVLRPARVVVSAGLPAHGQPDDGPGPDDGEG